MLVKQAYTQDQFMEFVAKSKFGKCEILPDEIGVMYGWKNIDPFHYETGVPMESYIHETTCNQF
jgi:hypothetical protein